ncbi:hybrid sensor histidine kinase/response regulator [Bacteroides oleiciplenus]|uniref:histidine kinase n=1 Tax=Bacteroides oleiciplenus TaxID=626931 RepID=A0A3E5B911_9BACE|nr:ATP-binding protein [Bacteroides oleiciplenus]RGN33815.1 response regulator [Bacteroides oleiciplenus]
MKSILKDTNNSEKLLNMVSDTLILMDKDGVCVDIAVHNVDLWFLKEEKLLGKNLLTMLPPRTYSEFYSEFRKVLLRKIKSTRNYELTLQDETYFFKCIMQPYGDLILCQYRDITERSQRKLELENKNRELFEIQKAALIGSWFYDTSSQEFSYVGQTGVMCTDMTQNIRVDAYLNTILPEDRASFNDWLTANLKGDMEESIDYRILFNGKIYYIRLKAFARECYKDGNITLEGYIQNITDIQQKRNDINLLTHAINNSTEDIFAAHEDGSLIFANRQFMLHHNLGSTEDITQLKIYEIQSYAQNKEKWQEMVTNVKNGERQQTFTMYNPLPLRPDILAYECNAYWVTSDEGIGTFWAFGRDVSQRILHEQQIKRFNQILDKIIEHLPAGIVVKDIKNKFKYLYRNRESYNRDVPMQEAQGRDDFDFYPLETAKEKRRQDMEIASTGQEMHWITEERDGHGNPLFLDKRKMKIESKDFSPILLNIEWDITDMELMRRELMVAKEKAETSDQLKSAFLANMSHEIRTPLNAIVGFSRIIAESDNTEERKSYYEIVEANNERLLQLINEILDLSKIEAGIVEFSIATVRLHPLCKEIHDAHVFRCPTGVELIFEPSDEEISIASDKNRIFQVISNLIGNAFKFTTKGSISYGYRREGENIVFHVTDTGTGIAPEKIGKVFERFVKANNFAQGTGLGLAICKTIIERLGGNISVTSELDKGTTFTFTLPANAAQEEDKEMLKNALEGNEWTADEQSVIAESTESTPATPPKDTAMKTILIAEDTDSNYILTKAILGKEYHLERAKDGMEAVNMFVEINPDIILMDMKMPNLGGLDATKIIRELSPTVPIIALTAFAYDHDRKAAFDAGCNDFLTKPFTQEGLKETIKRWVKEK